MSTLNVVYLILASIVALAGAVAAGARVVGLLRERWIAQADNTRAMVTLTETVRRLDERLAKVEKRLDRP